MSIERLQIVITGLVQGVGFRPHVYRVATQLGLTGWVRNDTTGVLIEIQGELSSRFLKQLMIELPPLAKVEKIHSKQISPHINEDAFKIVESQNGLNNTLLSPDISICSACLSELFDPNSRYYRYPFLNCTHCGPRLTITRRLPYDRCQTSMDNFQLCEDCHKDYSDPTNRRYHAQSTACVKCGPQFSASIQEVAKHIMAGEIIALKGVGGYQFIANASNVQTVQKLRDRKNRDAKPFALMVANLISARSIVEMDINAEKLLASKERPIVLLRKKNNILPESIAPGLSNFGIMLPSTPWHYLLFNAFIGNPDGQAWLEKLQSSILIVSSANYTGNPLVIDDEVAARELKAIADKVISYNRKIVTRVDDSVVRIIHDFPIFIRRARSYVPTSIKLPHAIPSTLAMGGHLKTTFCLTRHAEAFVSQHIGSLNNKDTIDFFYEALNHLLQFLDIKPQRIAHDLHPDFYTTKMANEYGIPVFPIQHHHAHLAAVAAEHHFQERALGLALDGYGYGINGEAWGGELLLLENVTFERLGSFYSLPQLGGDACAREPWRMAAAVLHSLGRGNEIAVRFRNQHHAELLAQLLENQINIPQTSSCGRLFDAASALLGIREISQYEGQAAMQLESLVTQPQILAKGWSSNETQFNMLPTLEYLTNVDPVTGANLFHGTLIAGLGEWVSEWAEKMSVNVVLLSGGCFLNKVLAEGLVQKLMDYGLKSYLPRQLPPNDGGISLGQAWIAGRM